ncbi:hypothetical protein BN970_07149 [Mycolicibacterium conceptionense]|uniref:Uncharacterized protein n=1 Tax=Mycolicibacterium conceptionense TaxID=451644 RepID=A0A0U1DZC2_9MYCO|nr:hypothetical protein BN970_07149 [Mycolicibacterium conceptionense]
MIAHLHTVWDGVAGLQASDTATSGMHVDNPFEVATDLHQRTVATIEATGFTSTGMAMALEWTHTAMGSLVFHAPTTRPG